MGRKFEFTEEFDVSPEKAYATLTDEKLWQKRSAEADGRATVTYEALPDGGFTVTMSEGVGAQVLPGVVKKVIRGDITISRRDTWGTFDGERATGTLDGGSTGLPAKVHGDFTLAPSSAGSTLTLIGTAEVKIPLVGGKIESLVVDMIGNLVRTESKQAREFLRENG